MLGINRSDVGRRVCVANTLVSGWRDRVGARADRRCATVIKFLRACMVNLNLNCGDIMTLFLQTKEKEELKASSSREGNRRNYLLAVTRA